MSGKVPGHIRWRGVAAIAALLAAGVLGACGGHGPYTSASTTPKPSHASGSPGGGAHALTPAQARAYVRAVNLTAADLPGFTLAREPRQPTTETEKQLEHELLACIGAGVSGGSGHPVAQGSSGDFRRRGSAYDVGVSSEVSVSSGTGSGAADLRRLRSGRARACLGHFLSELLKGKHYTGASVAHVSIVQGSPPAPGTTGGYGWRVTATLDVRGIKLPYYMDILGFLYGPTQVSLLSTGLPVPLPAGIQERLFALLLTRATAFSH
ncbi:MAG TPA: hypothetical protein VF380_05990 [Solirubrobacteraceae bacterium]